MGARVITLAEPVEWFGQQVTSVTLREPRGAHLQRFGEPRLPVFLREGSSYMVDRDDAVSSYLDALLSLDGTNPVDGGGAAFYGKLSLADGIAIRDALFSFFTDARFAMLPKKQTVSSST